MIYRFQDLAELAEFFLDQSAKFSEHCANCGEPKNTCILHGFQARRLRDAALACEQSELGLKDPRVFAASGLFHIVVSSSPEQ
ncbi:MAG: hypothetical protein NTY66_02935 [Candidatus Vogelbacteria bacterium]|nr:hypothetical protein [Candidatus Vogelbacteria bacterium]